MIYIEKNQPHWIVWPVIAFGKSDEEGFWVGLAWLNKEIGWRTKGEQQ